MSEHGALYLEIWPAVVVLAAFLLLAFRHVTAMPQSPECRCRGAVPVHIVTGEKVSTWCPDRGKTVYMARWVFRGE